MKEASLEDFTNIGIPLPVAEKLKEKFEEQS